jgi:hypothetical protein
VISARLIAAIGLCVLALPALAAPKPLGTDEIRSLLTGNTVHGTWAGREYFSYFEAMDYLSRAGPAREPRPLAGS